MDFNTWHPLATNLLRTLHKWVPDRRKQPHKVMPSIHNVGYYWIKLKHAEISTE